LHAWGEAKGVRLSDLGVRLTYTSNRPASESTGPDIDFAVPLAD
jgi:hypothetical protein